MNRNQTSGSVNNSDSSSGDYWQDSETEVLPSFRKVSLQASPSQVDDDAESRGRFLPSPNSTPAPPRKPRSWIGRHRVLIGVCLALLLVAVIAPFAASKLLNKTPHVTLYVVQNQTLTSYVGGGGLTAPNQSLDIIYPVNARVTGVSVQVGQTVKQGDKLITLDSADLNSQLQQAYSSWQAALQYLYSVEFQGAPPTTIASAQASVTSAQGRYEALQEQLNSPEYSNGNILAAISGIVTAVNASPGAIIPSGTALLTIQDVSTLIVKAQFPLAQRSQVQVGETAQVYPAATPNQSYSGKVVTVNLSLTNVGSSTFEVWIDVPNADLQLLTGESVYARISSQQQLPTVPSVSVINPDADSIVFVYANGRVHVRHVVVGVRDGGRFGIISGLQVGDKIVTIGQHQLSDNQPVIVSGTQN